MGVSYSAVIIADSKHDKDFNSQVMAVDKASIIEVKVLRRRGFVISLIPIQE